MNILEIEKKDIPRCAETFVATYNDMPWNYDWALDGAIQYLGEYLDAPRFKGFMICEGDQVAGALLGHSKTWWTNAQFMIDELFIAPDKQGKGYGKILLQAAEKYAQAASIDRITLMTNKFMPALQFYNKNDFSKVDQYVFMFKELSL